jgi:hypothetical protein
MSELIKAAFTPEGWAKILSQQDEPAWRHYGQGDHEAAAIHLYGQPFGFTWEMVEMLDTAILDCSTEWVYDGAEADIGVLRALRDRIAALLPPREP